MDEATYYRVYLDLDMQPDLFEGEDTTEEMQRREAEAAGREYGCYNLICQEQTPTAGAFA